MTQRTDRDELHAEPAKFRQICGRAFQAVAVSLLPLGSTDFLLFFASDTC
jgi:hypothetical protein